MSKGKRYRYSLPNIPSESFCYVPTGTTRYSDYLQGEGACLFSGHPAISSMQPASNLLYTHNVCQTALACFLFFVFGVVIQDVGARETEMRCGSSRTPEVRCKARVDEEPS